MVRLEQRIERLEEKAAAVSDVVPWFQNPGPIVGVEVDAGCGEEAEQAAIAREMARRGLTADDEPRVVVVRLARDGLA